MRLFDQTMHTQQDWFIRRGIYVILQKAKIICYRNLVYNTYRFINSHTNINFRLKMEYIQHALQVCRGGQA